MNMKLNKNQKPIFHLTTKILNLKIKNRMKILKFQWLINPIYN